MVDKGESHEAARGQEQSPGPRPIAVAIDQDPHGRGAPRVVAKGRGALAEQILQIAFDRGVKVRSDADLAEILAAVEIDTEVPLQALAAVAEILSYVYRAQNQGGVQAKS
jgi:flagellar biosynthesis protein